MRYIWDLPTCPRCVPVAASYVSALQRGAWHPLQTVDVMCLLIVALGLNAARILIPYGCAFFELT